MRGKLLTIFFETVFSSDSKYMTVHQTKGLEWKEVVVSLKPSKFDETTFENMFSDPQILAETTQEEFTRMFYVACSRAEEQPYVHLKTKSVGLEAFLGKEDFDNSFDCVTC